MTEKKLYRYYNSYRPPGYAQSPDGWVNIEVWMPAKTIPGTNAHALGWVEYDHKLDFEIIWKWELRPADEIECIEFAFYNDEHRNLEKAKSNMQMYIDCGVEKLKSMLDEGYTDWRIDAIIRYIQLKEAQNE